ncbi:MAG: cytochrome B [Myxococcota bacterium]
MYDILIALHSWLRWLVVLGGVAAISLAVQGLVKGTEYHKPHKVSGIVFLASTHTMLILGFALFFVSPTVNAALGDMGAAMKIKAVRFWAIEHTTLMVLAAVAVTVGYSAAKRATQSASKYKRALIGFGIGFTLIIMGIPWPFRAEVARVLFRL